MTFLQAWGLLFVGSRRILSSMFFGYLLLVCVSLNASYSTTCYEESVTARTAVARFTGSYQLFVLLLESIESRGEFLTPNTLSDLTGRVDQHLHAIVESDTADNEFMLECIMGNLENAYVDLRAFVRSLLDHDFIIIERLLPDRFIQHSVEKWTVEMDLARKSYFDCISHPAPNRTKLWQPPLMALIQGVSDVLESLVHRQTMQANAELIV